MKERRRDHTADHAAKWTEAEREAYRDDRAGAEEKRQAGLSGIGLSDWRELKRLNELAHGELTARFLASREAKGDEC